MITGAVYETVLSPNHLMGQLPEEHIVGASMDHFQRAHARPSPIATPIWKASPVSNSELFKFKEH